MRNKDNRNERRRVFSSGNEVVHDVVPERQISITFNMNEVEVIPYSDIGDWSIECENCKGLSFNNEQGRSKNSCCHGVKINLQSLSSYHSELEILFTSNDERSKHCLQNIRVYNNGLAFASVNAKSAHITGRGPYCIRVLGETYNKATTSLFLKSNPRYGQIYIFDDNEKVNYPLYSRVTENVWIYLPD
ncbi:uncharacterized protein B4U80_06722 [Leptotrombidium deliense]|uniref:Uncharacterized protein n=1 Tax=Leptotrombidium deliense TaxID=299467 RepID=A0A443RT54_9ACAR|nr:uncharacterized protein B4U80_06722 [Leptotrombidium deliense]